jgi:hypothetical protein
MGRAGAVPPAPAPGTRRGCQRREEERRPQCGRRVLDAAKRAEIVRLYLEGAPYLSLAPRFDVTRIAIRHVLVAAGIKLRSKQRHRTWTLNEDFFDSIATEVQAYVAGFHAADGNCYENEMRIELARKDRSHLQVIADLMGSNAPVIDSTRIQRDRRTGAPVERRFSRINFCSWRLVKQLKALGLGPNKHARCLPPHLSPVLLGHFFRGLFDGDGSIGRVNLTGGGECWQVSVVGNQEMVSALSSFLRQETGIFVPARRRPQDGTWAVQYMGNRYPKTVASRLYKDATVSLARKYSLFQQMILWRQK